MIPNSTVYLLTNIKLDRGYSNTIYFADKTTQQSYFLGKVKYTLNNLMYQRYNNNIIRIPRNVSDLYDCNYLVFQNTNYSNKYFYAFIDDVRYINDKMSEVEFTIDIMQTWFLFDCELGASFVEREHSWTDNIGDNLVPENLELGEYVIGDIASTQKTQATSIIVASTFDKEFNDSTGGEYNKIYSGLELSEFRSVEEVNAFIEEAVQQGKGNGIVSIFMMSNQFFTYKNSGITPSYNINIPKAYSNIYSGYTPKNNKLYTYPFNFLYVNNLQGQQAVFPYEFFSDDDNATFTLTGDCTLNPSVLLFPKGYKGTPLVNLDERMSLGGYPQCSYTTDTFQNWFSQNVANLGLSAVGGIATGLLTSLTPVGRVGSMIGTVTGQNQGALWASLGGTIANIVGQVYQHAIAPPQSHNANGVSSNVAFGQQDFMFANKHITDEFCKIIDNYFTMFGYQTNKLKIPNISSRPHYNYVKTVGCEIHGNCPQRVVDEIRNIFDRGVTFWKNGDVIGNYLILDNRPT